MLKPRYVFFGVVFFLAATPYLLPGYIASHPSYLSLSSILVRVGSLLLLVLVLYFIRRLERNTKGDVSLTKSEKLFVITTELFAPIIAAAFYYYCWKRRFPTKAHQANKYQWVIFGVGMIIALGKFTLSTASAA